MISYEQIIKELKLKSLIYIEILRIEKQENNKKVLFRTRKAYKATEYGRYVSSFWEKIEYLLDNSFNLAQFEKINKKYKIKGKNLSTTYKIKRNIICNCCLKKTTEKNGSIHIIQNEDFTNSINFICNKCKLKTKEHQIIKSYKINRKLFNL